MENIEFMVDIDAPKEKVWQCIVNQEKLREWWGEKKLRMDARMGGEVEEPHVQRDGSVTFTRGEVITVVPNHRFSFTWQDDDWEGETLVTFYLLPQDQKTKLYFLHSEWNSLPASKREKIKSVVREIWKEKLASLKFFAESREK